MVHSKNLKEAFKRGDVKDIAQLLLSYVVILGVAYVALWLGSETLGKLFHGVGDFFAAVSRAVS